MTVIAANAPNFCHDQRVCFIGGEGTVESYRSEADTWIYLIKMSMGPEPDFGRVGGETTVVLLESDLWAV
ncbi:hypothetical protein Lepto7375DRAFT_1913 [Leptolyngbya sp. PCC 7375]|nr:hypothetical protein Lepto7375DRAFT_1913 [Leptolyngbya sp. PCC 7375]